MKDVRKKISNILTFGIFSSSIVILLGIILAIFGNSEYNLNKFYFFDFKKFKLENFLEYENLMMIGIFILILTPIIRVIGMGIEYAIIKDYKYMRISLIIVFILVISLVIGLQAVSYTHLTLPTICSV